MAVNAEFEDDDYIDMELNSSCSPQSKEFDFKMAFTCSSNKKKEEDGEEEEEEAMSCCPADELFYKGKLLPLLLHPRRIMVQSLLFPAAATGEKDDNYYNLSMMPLRSCSTAPGTRTLSTPLGSANISPSESRRVSCELVPDDRFFRWSSELIRNDEKKLKKRPWLLKKFKLSKHYILGQKMRNSKAYLKSLFAKYAAKPKGIVVINGEAEKEEDGKISKKNKPVYYPTTISSILRSHAEIHRRSFSGAIKRRPLPKPSSSSSCSSSSSSSSSVNNPRGGSTAEQLLFLRRSNSASEIENAIEAAIAHCKRSQQKILDSKTKTVS